MPLTYEFRCVKCHHTFEMRQAMTAPPPQLCPACDGIDTVERVISDGAGFLLKGGGCVRPGCWARTQPSPKATWLVEYDLLSEPDKEADRMIGEALWSDGYVAGEEDNSHNPFCQSILRPMYITLGQLRHVVREAARDIDPPMLTWKDIFNTDHGSYGTQLRGCAAAAAARYPYYAWNGRIFVTDESGLVDTGLTVHDIAA